MGAVEVRRAASDDDLRAWASVKAAVVPDEPASVDELRRDLESHALLLLASLHGEVAGCAVAKLSSVADTMFAMARVLAPMRRRGVGSALYAALSDHARSVGRTALRTYAAEGDEPTLGFLARRGFAEVSREWEARLDLTRPIPALAEAPPGVDVVALGERLDLAPAVHALAAVGLSDIPSAEEIGAGAYEDWRRENVEGALLEGSFIAVTDGEVVGSAGLTARGAQPGVAENLLTAVARDWRRRGVARALKTAQIEWARGAGFRRLVTYTAATNDAMRRLNEELGYVAWPATIVFYGPPAEAAR